MTAGRFITYEGGEGAGKTTQARRLAAHFSGLGHPVLLTREPGGAPGAEAIRTVVLGGHGLDPIAEAMLMFAARREHVVTTIRPALAAGMWVICDRFADSTRAYQCHGQGVSGEVYGSLTAMALDGMKPDLTLVLDLPPEAGLERARSRGVAADRFERLDTAFHARVRTGFLTIAASESARCAVIDATATPDVVFGAIVTTVEARLAP